MLRTNPAHASPQEAHISVQPTIHAQSMCCPTLHPPPRPSTQRGHPRCQDARLAGMPHLDRWQARVSCDVVVLWGASNAPTSCLGSVWVTLRSTPLCHSPCPSRALNTRVGLSRLAETGTRMGVGQCLSHVRCQHDRVTSLPRGHSLLRPCRAETVWTCLNRTRQKQTGPEQCETPHTPLWRVPHHQSNPPRHLVGRHKTLGGCAGADSHPPAPRTHTPHCNRHPSLPLPLPLPLYLSHHHHRQPSWTPSRPCGSPP